MGRNFDARVLSNAIDVKRAADAIVSSARTKVIEEWVEAAIETCLDDAIPRAELNEGEVHLLLAIYPDVDSIVEHFSRELEYAWRGRYGHNVELPWVMEAHSVFRPGDRRGVHTRAKVPTH